MDDGGYHVKWETTEKMGSESSCGWDETLPFEARAILAGETQAGISCVVFVRSSTIFDPSTPRKTNEGYVLRSKHEGNPEKQIVCDIHPESSCYRWIDDHTPRTGLMA